MASGYCYELEEGARPFASSDESWDTEVYEPTGGEAWRGQRRIDGETCQIFECPDGRFRAQVTSACRPQ